MLLPVAWRYSTAVWRPGDGTVKNGQKRFFLKRPLQKHSNSCLSLVVQHCCGCLSSNATGNGFARRRSVTEARMPRVNNGRIYGTRDVRDCDESNPPWRES